MYTLILITAKDVEEAERIAGHLVGLKLAACANIVSDVSSVFWWQGRLDKARETLIFLKTCEEKFNDIVAAVKTIHSYSCPEIIALPILAGSNEYLGWIKEVLDG